MGVQKPECVCRLIPSNLTPRGLERIGWRRLEKGWKCPVCTGLAGKRKRHPLRLDPDEDIIRCEPRKPFTKKPAAARRGKCVVCHGPVWISEKILIECPKGQPVCVDCVEADDDLYSEYMDEKDD